MKLLLTVYFLFATAAFSADLWFSEMENGDRVEVTEHSTGCFHNTKSYYEIKKSDGSYSFTEYAIAWDHSNPPKITEKKSMGTVLLTKEDIQGLDQLLRFYRGKKEGGSTTQVSLVVEYFEPTRRIRVENLDDGSAGYGLENRKDVVTFFALTRRFKKN